MIALFLVFIYIGLFTIGGGMVAIPLILQQVVMRGWLTESSFYAMVAIAQSTPGPIGINVATYVGFELYGVFGAFLATAGFILPSFMIVSFLASLLRKYRTHIIVVSWFKYIKAAIVGLVGYTLIKMILETFFPNNDFSQLSFTEIIFFIGMCIIFYFLQEKPWIAILLGGILGILFL